MPQQSPISFQMATKNVLIIDGNEAMQSLRAGVLRSVIARDKAPEDWVQRLRLLAVA